MKYNVSRKKFWKSNNQGIAVPEERKDFKAKCTKCKYEVEIK